MRAVAADGTGNLYVVGSYNGTISVGGLVLACISRAAAGQEYPLDLLGLAPGVYALRVQTGQGQAVQKLVVW